MQILKIIISFQEQSPSFISHSLHVGKSLLQEHYFPLKSLILSFLIQEDLILMYGRVFHFSEFLIVQIQSFLAKTLIFCQKSSINDFQTIILKLFWCYFNNFILLDFDFRKVKGRNRLIIYFLRLSIRRWCLLQKRHLII